MRRGVEGVDGCNLKGLSLHPPVAGVLTRDISAAVVTGDVDRLALKTVR